MSDFTARVQADARLKILQMLRGANEEPLNNEVLQMALASMGLRLTLDQVRGEMMWLADMRCITVIRVGHMIVAELAERGNEVAKGLSEVPGIARHVPGSGI